MNLISTILMFISFISFIAFIAILLIFSKMRNKSFDCNSFSNKIIKDLNITGDQTKNIVRKAVEKIFIQFYDNNRLIVQCSRIPGTTVLPPKEIRNLLEKDTYDVISSMKKNNTLTIHTELNLRTFYLQMRICSLLFDYHNKKGIEEFNKIDSERVQYKIRIKSLLDKMEQEGLSERYIWMIRILFNESCRKIESHIFDSFHTTTSQKQNIQDLMQQILDSCLLFLKQLDQKAISIDEQLETYEQLKKHHNNEINSKIQPILDDLFENSKINSKVSLDEVIIGNQNSCRQF